MNRNCFAFAYGYYYYFFAKSNSDLCCKGKPGQD